MTRSLDTDLVSVYKNKEVTINLAFEHETPESHGQDAGAVPHEADPRARGSGLKRKPRIGRPPLPRGQAKNVVLSLRLTSEELERIERAARRAGRTPSDWARDDILRAAESEAPYEVSVAGQ